MGIRGQRKLARDRLFQLSDVWLALESAESAQRGYLLTSDDSYVGPFIPSRDRKDAAIRALRGMYPPQDEAQLRLTLLDRILNDKFDEMAETVRVAGIGNLACALAIVRSNYGAQLTDAARAIYDKLKDRGQRDMESLRGASDNLLSRGFWMVGCACLFAMFALVAAMWVMNLDIAERRRIEADLRAANLAAQQATEAKSMFLATMSHELRTPLNAICGMSDFLLESQLGGEQRKFAEVMERSAMTLLSLVNDILDFSKIEAGKLELENRVFSTVQLFKSRLAIVQHQAETKDLVLREEIDANVPAYLRGDPGRIGQIILNLLSNAIKFTHSGSVTARLSALHERNSHIAALRVDIIDTGIGLSDEQIARLFRPFSQVHGTVQVSYGGTGLGLAICRQLVDLMGGDIGVQKNPEGGSMFRINLRLEVPEAAEVEATIAAAHPLTAAADNALPGPRSGGTILVAEDNAVNQLLIAKQLERLGYQSDVVPNGVQALQALSKRSYDLVLMDCQMPEMDGYEAARRIRAQEMATGKRVPIVALTASAIRGDAERCAAAGMDGHLTKPVNKELLAQTLKTWMMPR